MAFNFPDGASNGQTHTASNGTVYRYNGTTWVVDSAATTTTFDSKYLDTEQKFGTGAYLKRVELLIYTEPVNFRLEQY